VHVAERALYPYCAEKGFCCASSTPAAIGFCVPIRPLLLIPDEVFTGDHTVKVRTLAPSDTSDTDVILLAARNAASPGYFRYSYRRRFRTTYVCYFGDLSDGTSTPLALQPCPMPPLGLPKCVEGAHLYKDHCVGVKARW